MKFLLSLFLPLISLPVFSRMWGRIVRFRRPRILVKKVIERYRRVYHISMDDYEGKTEDYRSLADFFVRRLDPQKRPLVPVENAIVSPADGVLTAVETVFHDHVTQVKGKTYPLSGLVNAPLDFSQGWHVATIYLAPSNYHRYHYPLTGNLKGYCHTGTRLFPVNRVGVNRIPQLFIRNERMIIEIEEEQMSCYVAAIGATFVGSIKMAGITTPNRQLRHCWIPMNLAVKQLEEMGRFDMGSTLVMVIPKKMAEPIDHIVHQQVRVGQPLFSMLKSSFSH
jgi:phosphatidylserine decarboxylase